MKFKFKKINFKSPKLRKYLLRGSTFVLVAGCTLVGAYALTPNKTRTVDAPITKEEQEATYFNKFMSHITDSLDNEEESFGLGATISNLEVSWPTKDGVYENKIGLNGSLNLIMRSLKDLDFSLDVTANYNNRSLDLGIGYVDKSIYLALQDLRIKSPEQTTNEFLNYVYELFFNEDNPDGLGIDLNLDTFVNEALGSFDLASMLSSISLPVTTEKVEGDYVYIDLKIDDIVIKMVLRKNDLTLKSVDLGELKIGNVTIKGKLECDVITKVLPLDDPAYPKQRGEFVDAISYIGWIDRIFDLFETRKFGFDLAAQVTLDNEEGTSELVNIEASINIDASEVLDFTNLQLGSEDPNVGRPSTIITDSDSIDSLKEKSKTCVNENGKLKFGIKVSLKGQSGEEYANFDLSFFDDVGYLTFNEKDNNEATMRAKIDINTVSSLIEKLPDILADFTSSADSGRKISKKRAADANNDILSSITDSDLISAIKNGDYSGILDVLKDIRNDNDGVSLALDLSPLGLGSSSEVSLKVNNGVSNANHILAIDVNNVEIGDINLAAQAKDSEFSEETINKVVENKDLYDDMSFTNDIIDQVSNILSTKKAKLSLSGSIIGENNEALNIAGVAQFDIDEKIGYGSVNLRQYSDSFVSENKYMDHNINFDINNNNTDESVRNMLFSYNDNLKAKITTNTISDIVTLFTDLLNSDDERFTKFTDSIVEMLLGGAIADIIAKKDFLEFAKPTYLKSVKQSNNGNTLSVVIAGSALGLESDININILFEDLDGTKTIKTLEVKNLALLGKTINISVNLDDFDENYTSPINKNDTFMDFSEVKVLLDFGINTTKLSYYHLSAKVVLNLVGFDTLNFTLDFHIHVDGKKTKVYGVIPDVPSLSILFSNDAISVDVNTEFVFEPTEDVSGLFHIVRNEDHPIGKDEVNYYQCDSGSFLDNIFTYLLVDMLNLQQSKVSSLTSLSLDGDKDYDPDYSKMFADNGFSYNHNASTGVNTWDVNLNMNYLTGMDMLKQLSVTLNGIDSGRSGLFTDAHIEMGVASLLTVKADLTLENPSFSTYDWPQEIENKYNTVLGWYYNLTDADKATFNSQFKNNPLKTYRVVEARNYF